MITAASLKDAILSLHAGAKTKIWLTARIPPLSSAKEKPAAS